MSIDYAEQRSYLDDLFRVYPTIPDGIREIHETSWKGIEKAFKKKDDIVLVENLLDFELFPIKDSYVAYLKRDRTALERNPATVARLSGRLYEMGLDNIYKQCSQPKETNRQIGPLFKRWLDKKSLGIEPVGVDEFLGTKGNAILRGSDAEMMSFAREHLHYTHHKGLDFVARFNGTYVIGEAKFLTDFGGHQNAQCVDVVNNELVENMKTEKVIILDGFLRLLDYNKMYKVFSEIYNSYTIMSILVFRNYLYQV